MPLIRRAGRPGLLGTVARTAVISGTATAVSGAVASRQHQAAAARQQAAAFEQQQAAAAQQEAAFAAAPPPPAPPVAQSPAPDGSDVLAKLQQLATLHQQGVLNDAEFAQAKALILGS